MRKILLATTALMAFAGAAQASETPLQVTLGGSVDFRAAIVHESQKNNPATTPQRRGDFMTEYGINIAAEGQSNGVEYGAFINIGNQPEYNNAQATMDEAYVWIAGNYGKLVMGDERGASQLFVAAPSVGLGQADGEFIDFTPDLAGVDLRATYLDDKETDTKITYYTPKFGNDDHKVQVGVSFIPTVAEKGSAVNVYSDGDGYENVVEAAIKYEGQFDEIGVAVTPMIITGDGLGSKSNGASERYSTLWGLGANVMYGNYTVGGSYVDGGHFGSASSVATKYQGVWSFGASYTGFEDIELALNYVMGKGYLRGSNNQRTYFDSYDAIGAGGTYNWFPGMVTSADVVFYDQNHQVSARNLKGYVMMLSQKMSF